MKNLTAILVVVLLFQLISMESFGQCAMCKAVVESSNGSQGGVAEGLNKGILYLMGVPYLLIATVGLVFFRDKIKKLFFGKN